MSPESGQSKVGRFMDGTTDNAVVNWLSKNVPILAVLCGAVWFVAERTESPAVNAERLTAAIRPLAAEIKQVRVDLNAHDHLPGHPVSVARVEAIEATLAEVRTDVKEVLKIARNGSR